MTLQRYRTDSPLYWDDLDGNVCLHADAMAYAEQRVGELREIIGRQDLQISINKSEIAAKDAELVSLRAANAKLRSCWKCPCCGGYDAGGLELHCSGCGRSFDEANAERTVTGD